jgi:hypothetical protein
MTELSTPDESAAARPTPEWPRGSQPGVTDPLVQQSLARLAALPAAPVTEHEALYNDLHEELRAALDADPSTPGPSTPGPRDGGA